jgi:hypothetical protein
MCSCDFFSLPLLLPHSTVPAFYISICAKKHTSEMKMFKFRPRRVSGANKKRIGSIKFIYFAGWHSAVCVNIFYRLLRSSLFCANSTKTIFLLLSFYVRRSAHTPASDRRYIKIHRIFFGNIVPWLISLCLNLHETFLSLCRSIIAQ